MAVIPPSPEIYTSFTFGPSIAPAPTPVLLSQVTYSNTLSSSSAGGRQTVFRNEFTSTVFHDGCNILSMTSTVNPTALYTLPAVPTNTASATMVAPQSPWGFVSETTSTSCFTAQTRASGCYLSATTTIGNNIATVPSCQPTVAPYTACDYNGVVSWTNTCWYTYYQTFTSVSTGTCSSSSTYSSIQSTVLPSATTSTTLYYNNYPAPTATFGNATFPTGAPDLLAPPFLEYVAVNSTEWLGCCAPQKVLLRSFFNGIDIFLIFRHCGFLYDSKMPSFS
jgi:hypothetical protein